MRSLSLNGKNMRWTKKGKAWARETTIEKKKTIG